jgi:hypothetical protein
MPLSQQGGAGPPQQPAPPVLNTNGHGPAGNVGAALGQRSETAAPAAAQPQPRMPSVVVQHPPSVDDQGNEVCLAADQGRE